MLRATERARSDRARAGGPLPLAGDRRLGRRSDTPSKPWAYEAGRRAVEDALARRGEEAVVETTRRSRAATTSAAASGTTRSSA